MAHVHVYDVKPDGSCLYRSVFQVLKAYGYLLPVCSYIFKREIYSEDEFVVEVRKYISDKIVYEKDHGHIHRIFEKLSKDEDDIYEVILEGMPSWFVRKFPEQPKNEREFRKIVATNILKVTSWASEIDIPIFMRVLNKSLKGAISIEVVYDVPPKNKWNKNKLYLLNLGERHYNYIVDSKVKQCSSKKIRNPLSRRCVNVDGRVGTRVLRHNDRSSN